MSKFPGLFDQPYSSRQNGELCSVLPVAVSSDGRFAAYYDFNDKANPNPKIRLCRIDLDRRTLAIYQLVEAKRPTAIQFSPDSQWLVFSSRCDHIIYIWSIESNRLAQKLTGHTGDVSSIKFSPDGQFLASCSHDQTIRVWSVASGHRIRKFTGHFNWVWSIAFSPDGQLIVSGSQDRTVRVWSIELGREIKQLKWPGVDWPEVVTFSPDGQHIIAISIDNMIYVWSAASGCLRQLHRQSGRAWDIAFNRDDILIGRENKIIILRANEKRVRQIPGVGISLFRIGQTIYHGNLDRFLLDHIENFQLALTLRWPHSHLYDPRVWREVARFV